MGCELQPGQFATGREAASAELGVSGSAWYRSMQKLQEFGSLKMEANNRFTIVSIVNWEIYQGDVNSERTTSEQPPDNKRTTGEQPADTIEEGKEIKEGKERKNTPPQAIKIPEDFRECWERWELFVLERTGRKIGAIEAEAVLMDLMNRGAEKAMRDVLFTVRVSRNATRILDSNNDYDKKPTTNSGGKKKVAW